MDNRKPIGFRLKGFKNFYIRDIRDSEQGDDRDHFLALISVLEKATEIAGNQVFEKEAYEQAYQIAKEDNAVLRDLPKEAVGGQDSQASGKKFEVGIFIFDTRLVPSQCRVWAACTISMCGYDFRERHHDDVHLPRSDVGQEFAAGGPPRSSRWNLGHAFSRSRLGATVSGQIALDFVNS